MDGKLEQCRGNGCGAVGLWGRQRDAGLRRCTHTLVMGGGLAFRTIGDKKTSAWQQMLRFYEITFFFFCFVTRQQRSPLSLRCSWSNSLMFAFFCFFFTLLGLVPLKNFIGSYNQNQIHFISPERNSYQSRVLCKTFEFLRRHLGFCRPSRVIRGHSIFC